MISQNIAKSLIPENLREIELFNKIIEIFIEYMQENSNLSLDVTNFLNKPEPQIFEELIKIYAKNFYEVVNKSKNNPILKEKIIQEHKKFNLEYVDRLDINVLNLLDFDKLTLLKNFQQSKGNLKSIEFIYEIFNKIQFENSILQNDKIFEVLDTGTPMVYQIKTNMLEEIFVNFVKPLTHPVGWKYVYARLVSEIFKDYFFVEEIYDIAILQVYHKDFTDDFKLNRGFLFENDIDGNALLDNGLPKLYKAENKDVLNVTRFGSFYKTLNLDSEVNLVQNPEVSKIETNYNQTEQNTTITITFKSGEILEQTSNPRTLKLYYGKGPNDLNKIIKKDYTPFIGSYSLYLNYNTRLELKLKDKINFDSATGLIDTTGNKLFCGCGNAFVSQDLKCGEKTLNQTDYNKQTVVSPLSVGLDSRQVFKGVKYKYQKLYFYIDLTRIKKIEFPLTISLDGDAFTLNYTNKHIKIVKFNGIRLNKTRTLENSYYDKTFQLEIINQNGELIESVSFNLIPRVDYTETQTSKSDMEFEESLNKEYSRDSYILDISNISIPDHFNENLESYSLVWDYLDYEYFADLDLSQRIKDKPFISSFELFDYKPPLYYSNLVGHFRIAGNDFGYNQRTQEIHLLGSQGWFCNDDFSIESFKN